MSPRKRTLPIATSSGVAPKVSTTDAEWESLERALGKGIPSGARTQIVALTNDFLYWASFELTVEPRSGSKERLAKVHKAAAALQRELKDGDPSDAAFFANQLIEKHFNDRRVGARRKRVGASRKIDSLFDTLTSFRVACKLAQDELDGEGLAEFQPGERWAYWIRNLTKILDGNDLPTQVRKDTDKTRSGEASPFVRFVKHLQSCFDPKYRRSTQSDGALALAITRTRRVTNVRIKSNYKTRQ
jgi:hypothetical protein